MDTPKLTENDLKMILDALCVHYSREIQLDAFEARKRQSPLFRRRLGWPAMNPQTTRELH